MIDAGWPRYSTCQYLHPITNNYYVFAETISQSWSCLNGEPIPDSPSPRTRSKRKRARAFSDPPSANLRSEKTKPTSENAKAMCPICTLPVPRYRGYLRFANRSTAFFHRACFEHCSGRPCSYIHHLWNDCPDGRVVPSDYNPKLLSTLSTATFSSTRRVRKEIRSDHGWFLD